MIMQTLRALAVGTMLLGVTACTSIASETETACENLPEGDVCAYDATRDASEDVLAAQEKAEQEGLKSLIVMGANWCHDSRALAGYFETERLKTLINEHYSLVYVDVGQKNRNLDIARSLGLGGIVGTPTVIIQKPDGTVMNLDTAVSWRNSASRTADDIYEELERYASIE